ncbi:unnamed protein product, partial [Coccothraustes coccothraustes]
GWVSRGGQRLLLAIRTCLHTAGALSSLRTDLLAVMLQGGGEATAPHLNTLHTHPKRNFVHTCSCRWNNREKNPTAG